MKGKNHQKDLAYAYRASLLFSYPLFFNTGSYAPKPCISLVPVSGMLQRQHTPDTGTSHVNMTRIAAYPFLQALVTRDGLYTVPDGSGSDRGEIPSAGLFRQTPGDSAEHFCLSMKRDDARKLIEQNPNEGAFRGM